MTNGLDTDVKTLRAEMTQLRADLGKITDTLQDLVRHGRAEATDRVKQSGAKMRATVESKVQDVAHEIEERPVTAALTAFGLGLILGLLFGNRRS